MYVPFTFYPAAHSPRIPQGMSRGAVLRSVAAACVAGGVAWTSTANEVSAKAPAPVMKLPEGGLAVESRIYLRSAQYRLGALRYPCCIYIASGADFATRSAATTSMLCTRAVEMCTTCRECLRFTKWSTFCFNHVHLSFPPRDANVACLVGR